MMQIQSTLGTILLTTLLLAGCGSDPADTRHNTGMAGEHNLLDQTHEPIDQMIAVIHPTQGNETRGVVRFTREGDQVRVEAIINGLNNESLHGFHIHEFGDCSADNAISAGGHFNPYEQPHASPLDSERHAGDLGNLESDGEGSAQLSYLDPVLSLEGPSSILGRGVVVHADEDDFETQPTGDAGGRIGCGVIGIAQPGN